MRGDPLGGKSGDSLDRQVSSGVEGRISTQSANLYIYWCSRMHFYTERQLLHVPVQKDAFLHRAPFSTYTGVDGCISTQSAVFYIYRRRWMNFYTERHFLHILVHRRRVLIQHTLVLTKHRQAVA